jgi:ferredoxin
MAIAHSLYNESGVPSVDRRTCTGCGLCAAICPSEVLEFKDRQVLVRQSAFGCIACGHCMMVCPSGSITVTGRGLSPGDVVALPPREAQATPDSLAALMLARRSVRHFTDGDVPGDVLGKILEMAQTAPMGIPPWDVGCVTIRGRQRVQDLAGRVIKGYERFLRMFRPWVLSLMRPFMSKATYGQFRTFLLPLADLLVSNRRKGRDVLFYDAPAVMIFHHSPYADAADAVIACTYAMLAAESLGLGTTMIGSAAPLLQRNKAMSKTWGIPAGHKAAIVLIVGYPAVTFKHAIRRRFGKIGTK